jgi:hypothetical protein
VDIDSEVDPLQITNLSTMKCAHFRLIVEI